MKIIDTTPDYLKALGACYLSVEVDNSAVTLSLSALRAVCGQWVLLLGDEREELSPALTPASVKRILRQWAIARLRAALAEFDEK